MFTHVYTVVFGVATILRPHFRSTYLLIVHEVSPPSSSAPTPIRGFRTLPRWAGVSEPDRALGTKTNVFVDGDRQKLLNVSKYPLKYPQFHGRRAILF